MYQRLALPPSGTTGSFQPWDQASKRCLRACEDIANIVRGVNADDLKRTSPHLILCIFVAARFYLAYGISNRMELPWPNNIDELFKEALERHVDDLMYALDILGQRWKFATRLRGVVGCAMTEFRSSQISKSLPVQFYDLRYSALDIYESLKTWSEEPHAVEFFGGLAPLGNLY